MPYLDTPCYVLGEDKFTHDNLYYGMVGEIWVNEILKKAFPDFKWTHNPFSKHNLLSSRYRYACSHGIDHMGTDPNNEFYPIYGETKNLKQQPKPYGTDFIRRHVLPRLKGLRGLKILFITYLKLLTRNALYLLKHNGIIPFEIGEQLTSTNFKNPETYLKLLNLAQRLKQAVKPTPFLSISLTNYALTNYLKPLLVNNINSDSQPYAVDNEPYAENKQYDTVYTNYCVAVGILELLRNSGKG
jgi:hypothetical protein